MYPLCVNHLDLCMSDFLSLEDIEESFNYEPSSEDMEFWTNLLGGIYEKSCTYQPKHRPENLPQYCDEG